MKFTLLLIFSSFVSSLYAITPYRFIVNDQGGHVQFATATVGNIPVFDEQELSGVSAFEGRKGRDTTITNYAPTLIEINLSTCPLTINGTGDYESLFTKGGLKPKIKQLRKAIDESSDLPISETKDLRERIRWLISYFQSLP